MRRSIPFYSVLFAAVLFCGTSAAADLPEISEVAARKANCLRASVIMHNGGTQCSATIFAADKRAAGIGDAHCFTGVIGGKFWVSFTDSTHTLATLEAIDRPNDLALFTVDAADILDVATLPAKMPAKFKAYESIGYPKGEGPTWQTLDVARDPVGIVGMVRKPRENPYAWMERWSFVPRNGIFPGHSGSGVFADGHLVAVTNGGDPKHLVAAPHNIVVDFVKKHAARLKDCGPLFDNQVAQTSNRQPLIATILPSPPPPPEEEIGPPPDWHAKPNVPVEDGIYPGHGKLPKRLRGIKTRAGLLDGAVKAVGELESKVEAQNAEIEALKARLEQTGAPPDSTGENPVPAPVVNPEPAPKSHPLFAVVCFFSIINAAVVIDFISRSKTTA